MNGSIEYFNGDPLCMVDVTQKRFSLKLDLFRVLLATATVAIQFDMDQVIDTFRIPFFRSISRKSYGKQTL